MLRIGILLSGRGRGTNLQAILAACASGYIPGQVALVLSTTASAPALELARAAGVPARFVDPEAEEDPGALDRELALRFGEAEVGLVALTGYLRLLGPEMLRRYPLRIINVHPSLLPAFGGRGFYGHHVHEAVLESGTRFSGATVQFVDPEYDHGPIILQAVVPVLDDDTPLDLAGRVLEQEHKLYPEAIRLFAQDRLRVEGRRVRLLPEAT
jgi:formyltetrahydrofolate-dependent phosphoribosylglycinamide formyltransferase